MRGGICTVQQALTAEAAMMVKQAVSLAKRRGHAQVTPLHVASAMLATSAGLLRRACLQCHSHPLQCKALELCFNVALNRLPASSPSPLLGPHYTHPAFSNALVAAFKRAQAHQRRGSVENQQQPILALKIELEQLIISILDDPSVSRVMREAGFSSPQVKSRVEQSVSVESKEISTTNPSSGQFLASQKPFDHVRHEDVNGVLSVMLNKRKNTVVLGESLAAAESVAKGVMESFERSQHGSVNFRFLQFINFPLFSLRTISKEEVERKLIELRCLVKSCVGRAGVVLYLGDLAWVSEYWSSSSSSSTRRSSHFSLEHVIMELKRLVSSSQLGDNSARVWLMGISTFQSYVKCKQGNPSLEEIWELHPLSIPVASLSLSLKFESDLEGDVSATMRSKDVAKDNHDHHFSNNNVAISSLPSWLQKYNEENKRNISNSHQEFCFTVGDLCKKWTSICNSGQKQPHFAEKPFNFSSLSPSNSFSSHDFKQSPKEYQFWALENETEDEPAKPELLSNPNSSPNSASSSEVIIDDDVQAFKELNAENLRILCDEMEKNVPWQKEIVPEIATTVLQCRSGMSQRKSNLKRFRHSEKDENCWLFFLGADANGKEKVARTLAKLVFGSQNDSFVSIGLSRFSSTRVDSYKRTRDESGISYIQRLGEAVNENPRRVFFMQDLEEVDESSQKGIRNAIETGKIALPCGETVLLRDSIVIFSCESFGASSSSSQRSDQKEHDDDHGVSLDLNIAVRDHEDSDSMTILESVDRKFVFEVNP